MKSPAVRYATAGFVLASIASALLFGRRRKSNIVGTVLNWRQQRELDRNLVTPAAATFGIVWPTLYTGLGTLAVHQALDSQEDNPRYEAARPWLWGCFALNAAFGYFFVRDSKEARRGAALITIANLAVAAGLYRSLRIGQEPVEGVEKVAQGSVSLYNGWLTAASVISALNLFLEEGLPGTKRGRELLAYGTLPLTAGIGLAVSHRNNDPVYLGTLVAAFTGVAAKQAGKNNGIAALAGGLAVVTAADMAYRLIDTEEAEAEVLEEPAGEVKQKRKPHVESAMVGKVKSKAKPKKAAPSPKH